MTAAAVALVLTYWIQPCEVVPASGCESGDAELAEWALAAWTRASGGTLSFRKAAAEGQARIRIYWASARGGLYGEARGGDVFVQPQAAKGARDRLARDAVVYLTCLHESGHALGLPHTANFEDIMYSFGFGGDITEYFARYRRKLRAREDIRKHSGMSGADEEKLKKLLPLC